MSNVDDPHHIKVTVEEIKNMQSQRPDVFAQLPPLQYIDGSWNIVTEDDAIALILNELDRTKYIEPVPAVPAETAMFRARYIMQQTPHNGGNLWEAALAVVEQLPEDAKGLALAALEYGNVLARHGKFVTMLAPALGLSEEDLDNLFRDAEKLEV